MFHAGGKISGNVPTSTRYYLYEVGMYVRADEEENA